MTAKPRILIVEDESIVALDIQNRLRRLGYIVPTFVSSGPAAVTKAAELQPDLILMDIQLPEVSGLDVTKWLKEDDNLRDIPVIAVTAFAMKGDEERIREGGCEAYISKPITVSMFLDTIRQFLGDR
jgi:two-component system cell cycle response regulator DivK